MSLKYEEGIIKMPDLQFDENCGGIGNIYFNSFQKYGERVALIKAATDEHYTYADLLAKCIRTALVFKKKGCKKQDLIAICSNKENLNANVPIIAGQFLGLITFSLDPLLTVDECTELLKQVQPKIIFVIEEAKDMVTKALNIVEAKTEIVLFGKAFEDIYFGEHDGANSFKPVFINDLQETCVIHFSSGSTGLPKPICLNHHFFMALICNYISNRMNKSFENKPVGAVSLRFANWFWVSTSIELMFYGSTGGCRILKENFNADEIWKLIDKYSITELCLTPLQCVEISSTIRPDGVDISSVTEITTGGYVLHKDYIHILRKLFPGTHISQIYGMTECGIATLFSKQIPKHLKLLDERPNSCGLPVPGLQYKVVDIHTGRICGPNQPGELYLKGRKILNGFYNKDASKSFDNDGYFRTGDLASFDEDFCFYIHDRIKSILGWKDWLIYPCHIEKILLEHPSVHNAVVIGIPHKIEGERLMGVVMLKENASKVLEKELVKYVNDRVEDYKRLREGIRFMNQFPVTITGKVNRMKIKTMVLNNLAV